MTLETINKLKRQLGRHFIPTVARYRLHVETYKRLGCEDLIEPFPTYAADITGAPEAMRDEMLRIDPVAPYESPVVYKQYSLPVQAEMYGGSPPGNRKKRTTRKRGGK